MSSFSISESEFQQAIPLIKALFSSQPNPVRNWGWRIHRPSPVCHERLEVYVYLTQPVAGMGDMRVRVIPDCVVNISQGAGVTPQAFAQLVIDRLNRVVSLPLQNYKKASSRPHNKPPSTWTSVGTF